ncbi:CCDC158 family protein [Mycoplasmopsis sturni]|uniref:GA module-containing protein n=1 Tax=Mycoplasmopsis sturni TaxID=39047 RepID=UPI0005696D4A|nr:GA module-containing protein [Mycoplasmopsis sturni]
MKKKKISLALASLSIPTVIFSLSVVQNTQDLGTQIDNLAKDSHGKKSNTIINLDKKTYTPDGINIDNQQTYFNFYINGAQRDGLSEEQKKLVDNSVNIALVNGTLDDPVQEWQITFNSGFPNGQYYVSNPNISIFLSNDLAFDQNYTNTLQSINTFKSDSWVFSNRAIPDLSKNDFRNLNSDSFQLNGLRPSYYNQLRVFRAPRLGSFNNSDEISRDLESRLNQIRSWGAWDQAPGLSVDYRISNNLGSFFTLRFDTRQTNSNNNQVGKGDNFVIRFRTIKNTESPSSSSASGTSFEGDSAHVKNGKIINPAVLSDGYTFVGANFSYNDNGYYGIRAKAYVAERKATSLYNIGIKETIGHPEYQNRQTTAPVLRYRLYNGSNNETYAEWNSDREFNPESINEFTTKYKAYVSNDLVKHYDRLKLGVSFVNSTDSENWEIVQPNNYQYNINQDVNALLFNVTINKINKNNSQEWKDKIDQLPYISNNLKTEFKNRVDTVYENPRNNLADQQAEEIYNLAKQQSGLGLISDKNHDNSGYAKNLLQKYQELMNVKDKIKYHYADEKLKQEFDNAFNEVLNGVGGTKNFAIVAEDNTDFNSDNGYTLYKLQRQLTPEEYNSLMKKMQDAYDYLNGLDVQDSFSFSQLDRAASTVDPNDNSDLAKILLNTVHSKLDPAITTQEQARNASGNTPMQVWDRNNTGEATTRNDVVFNGYSLEFIDIEHDENLNANGQIKLKYKIVSPKYKEDRRNLGDLSIREQIISGFQTEQQEIDRLNSINIGFDYRQKENFIPYNNINYPVIDGLDTIPEQYRLKRSDLLFTANNAANSEWRFVDNPDITKQAWINDSKQIKITNIRFGNSNDTENQTLDRNPKDGSIRFKYDLYSTKNGFEELKLNNNDPYRTISGFKTEAKRLGEIAGNRLRTKDLLVNAVNTIKMKEIFPNFETEQPSAKDMTISQYMTGSDVANREVFNKILALALPNEHVQFGDYWLDYTNRENRSNGGYEISNDYGTYIGRHFVLKSTLPGLEDVLGPKEEQYKGQIDIWMTLWRRGTEGDRVSRLANNNLGEYSGNKNIVPYDANSTNINDLNFIGEKKTINRWKNVNNQKVYEDKQVWSQDENQIFITDPAFIRFDARRGEVEYQYVVRSSRTNVGWIDQFTGTNYSDQWYYDTFIYTRKTTITGFKTEKNRVDEIIDQMPDINRLLEIYGRTDIKNNIPSKSKENIKSVIEQWLRDPDKELKNPDSWINTANQKNDVALVPDSLNWSGINDQDGTITGLTFKVQSTKNRLTDIQSKEKEPQNLADFYSIDKETQRLNNIEVQLDYTDKQNVIPYTTNQKNTLGDILNNPDLDIEQVLLTSPGWNKVNNEWVNEEQKAKLVLQPIDDDTTSRDALNGNIKVKYKLVSNDSERFDNPSSIESSEKEATIEGFKTEKQRVLEVVRSIKEKLNTDEFYSEADKNNTTSFEATRKQGEQTPGIDNSLLLANKLKAEFDKYHVDFKQDSDHSLQFSQLLSDFNSGAIAGIKFELKSTIDGLTSANSSFEEFGEGTTIDGFWTKEKEIELLKQVNPQFDYSSKENTIPYSVSEISPTLREHLNLSGYTSNDQESLIFTPQNENDRWNINNISVTDVDPKGTGANNTGTIKLAYTVQSTKNWRLNGESNSDSNLTSAKVTLPSNEHSDTYINGFKTEKQRLNEVLNQMPSLQALFNDHIDRNKKIFDENNNVTDEFKEEIKQLVNQWLSDHDPDHTNSYAEINDLVVGKFDQATGDISNITFNLKSTKDELNDVHSDTKDEQHINGFKTIKEEKARLTKVAEGLSIDYQPELKTEKVRYSTEDFKISELQLPKGWIQGPQDGEWFNESENVVLTNIRFSDPNAADGTVKIDYDVKTYQGDFAGTTKENPVQNTMISHFATEADRLDWILDNDPRANGIRVPIIDYNPNNSDTLLNAEDKKHTVDWINSKEDQSNPEAPTRLLDKLQQWFNNQSGADVKVVDLRAEYDNENGTITDIKYKLESKKQNLVPIETQPKITSTKYSQPQNAINFVTPQQVRDELQRAVDSVQAALDYINKTVPPYADNSTLEEEKLYNSLLESGWEKQLDEAGHVSFVKEHTRLEFVNQNNSDKPFSDSDPIGKPVANPVDNSASTNVHYKITSEWPDFKNKQDFTKNETKNITGFVTEKQRLNEIVKQLVEGSLIDDLVQDKANKLVDEITEEKIREALNNEIAKLNSPYGVKATIKEGGLTLAKNAKNGTIDVNFKLSSLVYGVDQDSNTNNELKEQDPSMTNNNTISGFKTNYTNVMEQFKKYGITDGADVGFTNKELQKKITANQAQAQDPNQYTLNIKDSIKSNHPELSGQWKVVTPESIEGELHDKYEQYLPKVVGHDEINGRTLVAYYLIDTDKEHADGDGLLPVSQKFYATVDGFQTELERLQSLKELVQNSIHNTKNKEERKPFLPTDELDVPDSDIGFQSDQAILNAEPNYVSAQTKTYTRDNTHGTIGVTHTYQTNKENSILYDIEDPELVTKENKPQVLAQLGFADLSDDQINNKKESELVITDTNEVVFDNYKTYLELLTEKVNELKNALNHSNATLEEARENNNYWSQDEKNNYIKQLEAEIDKFKKNTANDQNTIEQNDDFYLQAAEAITNIEADLKDVNNKKKEAFDGIYDLSFLNKKQKQERQKEIINSNQKPIEGSNNPTTDSIVQKATELNNSMDQLHRIVDGDSILRRNRNYNKIPNTVRELYENLIQDAKDLEANKSSVNGIEQEAWDKASRENNFNESIAIPQTSENDEHADWNKQQVDNLTKMLKLVKNEIEKNLNKLDDVKRQIDDMQYLSDQEKEALKARADNPDKTSNNGINDYDNVLNKAKQINKKKEDLFNEVSANPATDHTYEYLNNDQKNKVKTEIVKSILEDDSADSITQEAQSKISEGEHVDNYSEVEKRATDLNNSMKELKDREDAAPAIRSDSAKYGDATDETKAIYDQLIDAANKLKNNQYDKNSTQLPTWGDQLAKPEDNTWDKTQVDHLNDLIDQALKKLEAEASFKNNPYLSPEEKAKLYENVKNATSLDEIQKQIDTANSIKKTKKDLIDNLDVNFPHLNQDQKDAIKQEIINSLTPDTPIYEEIKNSHPQLETPNQVIERAGSLDDSMNDNQKLIADEDQIHNDPKYQKASKKYKDLYDHAINASKDLQNNRSDISSDTNNLQNDWDPNVAKPETSNADASDHKANWNKAQVDELNKIINDVLAKMAEFYDKIKSIQDKVDQLDYLSPEEKAKFKDQLENTENPEDANKIWEQAQKDNQAKKDIVDSILGQKHLNNDQKEYFKDQIINTQLHEEELLDNQKSVTEIQTTAQELDDKMSELEQVSDIASKLIDQPAFEQNASKGAQDAFIKAIQDAYDTITNKPINDNTNANLDKDQVQDLIDKIKLEHDKVIDNIIDNLDGLIEEEKPQIKENIHNQPTEDDILAELAKAKDISDSVNELIAKEAHYFNEGDLNQVVKDIDQLIKHLDDLGVSTKDFIETKEAISRYHSLLDALEKYRKTGVEESDYQELKEKLEQEISLVKFLNTTKYPKLNTLINTINASLKTYQAQSEDEIALVEALRAAEKDKFNNVVYDLNNRGHFDQYNNFANTLNRIKYFGKIVAGRADDYQLLQSIWNELSKLDFDDISNVLESALVKNFKEMRVAEEKLGFLWWVFLATNSALILGIIIALAKRRNKQ